MNTPEASCDWAAERATVASGSGYLHLNHASNSLPAATTYRAMRDYLQLEENIGAHRAAAQRADELDDVAPVLARLLGVKPHQIALVESASRGWAQALSALPRTRGIDVFVSEQEWAGNVINIRGMSHVRLKILTLPSTGSWADTLKDLEQSSREGRIPVVSLPVVDCMGRSQQQWTGVAQRIREAGGWLFVDASQAVGQMPVSMSGLGADVLVFPARKWLRGPRGIAVLALSERALADLGSPATMDIYGTELSEDPSGLRHGPDARRFQPYDCPPVLKLGLRQAVLDLLRVSPGQVHTRIESLARGLREALVPFGPALDVLPGNSGIVSFRVPRHDHAAIVQSLWAARVNAAVVTQRYAPLSIGPSDSVIRLSIHAINAESDAEEAVRHLHAALRQAQ